MSEVVQFIKISTKILDGNSFKFLKKDKKRNLLESVWLEILTLAGQVNNDGFFFNDEVDYDVKEFSVLFDRKESEINYSVDFYTKYRMIERVNGKLCVSNWMKYQKVEGLDKIREQTKERVKKCRERKNNVTECNATSNATVTHPSQETCVSEELRNKNEEYKSIDELMNKRINEYNIDLHSSNPFTLYIFHNGYCNSQDELDVQWYDAMFSSMTSKYDYDELKYVVSRFCKLVGDKVITNKLKYLEQSINTGMTIMHDRIRSNEEYAKELDDYLRGKEIIVDNGKDELCNTNN